jgi:Zn-dependent protease with chaperone function
MLILGLVLVLLSAASVAVLVAYNNSGGPEQTIVLFGRDWVTVTPLWAFVAGLVVSLVFALGVWMVAAAGRRSRAAKADYRAVRREARHAARERDNLAKQLERERATTEPAPAAAPAAAPAVQEPVTNVEGVRGLGIGRHFRRQNHPEQTPADK